MTRRSRRPIADKRGASSTRPPSERRPAETTDSSPPRSEAPPASHPPASHPPASRPPASHPPASHPPASHPPAGKPSGPPASIDAAVAQAGRANLAIISVPGPFAAREARRALENGLSVFLFSSGVTLEDEAELKQLAVSRGRLLMGPDCGTAIVDGHPLGFANHVRRGPIGIVGASGTGIQEVSALVHNLGSGISHAIGTGGRDLSVKVGGATTLMAVDMLARDPATQVLVLLSKPAAGTVAHRVLRRAADSHKPVVACFVGSEPAAYDVPGVITVATLEDAAREACRRAGIRVPDEVDVDVEGLGASPDASRAWGVGEGAEAPRFSSRQCDLVGLFSGGTLAYESLVLLAQALDLSSNLRLAGVRPLGGVGHRVVDFGEEEMGRGRPHPIFDPAERVHALRELSRDPRVAVVLLDVVLGFGAHEDPASQLAPAIREARKAAAERGGQLYFVACVVGTDLDPQRRSAQVAILEGAGVHVLGSNAAAARRALSVVCEIGDAALTPPPPEAGSASLLGGELVAVNVGLEAFAESLAAQDVEVSRVDWKPPAGGDERLARILAKLS